MKDARALTSGNGMNSNATAKHGAFALEERLVRLFDGFSASDLAFIWNVDGPDITLVRNARQRARATK